MEKSANKRWRESGTSLSFKDWIDRENKKQKPEGNFIPLIPESTFSEPSRIAQDTINATLRKSKEDIEKTAGFKTAAQADKSKVFGLDKNILIFSSVLIVGSLGFYFYKKMKKK